MLVICRMSLRAGERRGEGGREGSGVLHHMFVRSFGGIDDDELDSHRASSSTQMSHTDVLFLLFHLERDPTASTKLRSFLISRPLNVALSVCCRRRTRSPSGGSGEAAKLLHRGNRREGNYATAAVTASYIVARESETD